QAEFIVAKHRNGGLDNIRLKFIGKYGKFDNLDTDSFSFDEIPSRMNADEENFVKHLPSGQDVFGATDDDDLPF
ncbi:hypothetical protein GWI33_010984, partial [Rhynchophorus ferrugineus]